MADELCTFAMVEALVEDDIADDPKAAVMIDAAILLASDEARRISGAAWTAADVPGPVGRIVAAAVARWFANPTGLTVSRAGDETLGWGPDPDAGAIRFTDREAEALGAWGTPATSAGLASVQLAAPLPPAGERVYYAPTSSGSLWPFLVYRKDYR